MARTVAGNVAQGLQLTNDLTGVDLGAMLARLGGNSAKATADEARIDCSKSAGAVGRRTPQRIAVEANATSLGDERL